jgi:hypothetical protein
MNGAGPVISDQLSVISKTGKIQIIIILHMASESIEIKSPGEARA